MNPFYNPTGNPTPGSSGLSNLMRAEFAAIAAAFALLPTLAGNAGGVVVVNPSGTGLTVSPVAFPGPAGPFLSLGGGNVIGASTFSSAGTGLTISNNAVVGGTLGVTGTLGVGSTIQIGTGTGPGGDTFISTPSGSNINLLPQGSAIVKVLAPMTANRATFGNTATPIVAGAISPIMSSAIALSGTTTATGQFGWNTISIPGDTLANNGAAGLLNDLYIAHNFGGTAFGTTYAGSRQGIGISLMQAAAIAGTPGALGNFGVAGIGAGITMNASWGGTGLTGSTAAGSACVFNPYLVFASGYTNGGGGSGMEIDISGRAGSTFLDKVGVAVVLDSADAVQGVRGDAALMFANQSIQGAGRGWKALISAGGSAGYYPPATDGAFWIIVPNSTGDTLVVNKGLSWANGTFTTSAIETPGFTLDGSGNAKALTFKVGSNQVVGARQTGWSAMTGTPNVVAVYDTSTVTLAQLAGRVLSLQAALTSHGLIGT